MTCVTIFLVKCMSKFGIKILKGSINQDGGSNSEESDLFNMKTSKAGRPLSLSLFNLIVDMSVTTIYKSN